MQRKLNALLQSILPLTDNLNRELRIFLQSWCQTVCNRFWSLWFFKVWISQFNKTVGTDCACLWESAPQCVFTVKHNVLETEPLHYFTVITIFTNAISISSSIQTNKRHSLCLCFQNWHVEVYYSRVNHWTDHPCSSVYMFNIQYIGVCKLPCNSPACMWDTLSKEFICV